MKNLWRKLWNMAKGGHRKVQEMFIAPYKDAIPVKKIGFGVVAAVAHTSWLAFWTALGTVLAIPIMLSVIAFIFTYNS